MAVFAFKSQFLPKFFPGCQQIFLVLCKISQFKSSVPCISQVFLIICKFFWLSPSFPSFILHLFKFSLTLLKFLQEFLVSPKFSSKVFLVSPQFSLSFPSSILFLKFSCFSLSFPLKFSQFYQVFIKFYHRERTQGKILGETGKEAGRI